MTNHFEVESAIDEPVAKLAFHWARTGGGLRASNGSFLVDCVSSLLYMLLIRLGIKRDRTEDLAYLV
jgi:hypothetical protein